MLKMASISMTVVQHYANLPRNSSIITSA